MRDHDESAKVAAIFTLVCLLPLAPICYDPLYAFYCFFAWPLVISFIAFELLGLAALVGKGLVFGMAAVLCLLAGHVAFWGNSWGRENTAPRAFVGNASFSNLIGLPRTKACFLAQANHGSDCTEGRRVAGSWFLNLRAAVLVAV